jgi:hypothetical protein
VLWLGQTGGLGEAGAHKTCQLEALPVSLAGESGRLLSAMNNAAVEAL